MSIGQRLRAAREEQGVTLQQASDATRVRTPILAALEADDFAPSGGDIYARGHIRAYARFLGLDAAGLLEEYPGAAMPAPTAVAPTVAPGTRRPTTEVKGAHWGDLAAAVPARSAGQRAADPNRSPVDATVHNLATKVSEQRRMQPHRDLNWSALMLGVLAFVVVIGAVLVIGGITGNDAPDQVAGPTVSPTGVPTPTPTPTPSPTPTDLVAQIDGVQVKLRVPEGRSWVRVVGASQGKLFEGILEPGVVETFDDPDGITLRLGNAGAVTVVVNGQDLGTLGGVGEVVDVNLGPDGVIA